MEKSGSLAARMKGGGGVGVTGEGETRASSGRPYHPGKLPGGKLYLTCRHLFPTRYI